MLRGTVTVVYKSGAIVRFKARSMAVTRSGGDLEKIEWVAVDDYKPLHLGISEVAAVYWRPPLLHVLEYRFKIFVGMVKR